MLVLSRKVNEAIVVGGGSVVITIVEVRGNKVRVGIEASKDVVVDRAEIHARKTTHSKKMTSSISPKK
jgi:carbon storage regulator